MKRTATVGITTLCLAVVAPIGTAVAAGKGAVWQMDESSGATVMRDSSGNGNHGKIPSGVSPGGGVFTFKGTSRVQVPHDTTLNPGSADFSFSARVKRTGGNEDPNIIQKGQTDAPGGYYKIDYYNGRVNCKLVGSSGYKTLVVSANISDGQFHTIRCTKTATKVRLDVDPGTTIAKSSAVGVTIGSIANIKPLTIGGKINCTSCDFFTGQMQWARVDI